MRIDSSKPDTRDPQAFLTFYDQYAPALWGLILSAGLPASQSETILANTFLKAWQHPYRQTISERKVLTGLLRLAYGEGLPPNALKSVVKRL